MNFVMGGFEAMRRRSVALKPLACDVAAYDLVVLGTPVYAGTLPAPMRTFILQEGSRIRRATGFITASGREAENLKVLQEMRGLLPDIWREPGLFVCYSPNPNEVALGVSKAWGLELARATL